MSNTPSSESTIHFWLPDPDDIARVLHLLEICGYTDRHMALEEATQAGDTGSVFEVTIRRRPVPVSQSWREDITYGEASREGVWQA